MFAKTLSSLKDNLIQKTTNPFLGTLVLVWIFHNWKLVYGVFNFDKTWTLEKKWEFITTYLEPWRFTINLIECLSIATIVLFVTYFLLNFSRLIINFYEKIVSPWVYKVTDKSSIVLKSTYKQLEQERDLLEQRLEEERVRRIQVQSELDALEEKQSKNEVANNTGNKPSGNEYITLSKIDQNYSIEDFEKIIDQKFKKEAIDDSELLAFLQKFDYVDIDLTIGGKGNFYRFTPSGNALKQEFMRRY